MPFAQIPKRLPPATLIVVAMLTVAPTPGVPRAEAQLPPVAIVTQVTGRATLEGGGRRSLVRFDRLDAGAVIRTDREAQIVVVFRTGARILVGEASRLRLGTGGATRLAGTVETLSSVPTVPLVAPVSVADPATAAVRVRADGLTALAPAPGETTLAGLTTLEVAAIATDGYDFEIEAPDAAIVFRRRLTQPRVDVPPEALRPGVAFRWRARARSGAGFERTVVGWFQTLDAATDAERTRLRLAIAEPDADAHAFLAEVDLGLGLWRHALVGFRAAREAGARDRIVADRIVQVEQRLLGAPRQDHRKDP